MMNGIRSRNQRVVDCANTIKSLLIFALTDDVVMVPDEAIPCIEVLEEYAENPHHFKQDVESDEYVSPQVMIFGE